MKTSRQNVTRDKSTSKKSARSQRAGSASQHSGADQSGSRRRGGSGRSGGDRRPFADGVMTALLRNRITLESFTNLRRALLISGVANIVLAAALGFAANTETEHVYFATRPDGSLIKLTPVSEPLQNEQQVRNWVAQAVTDAFQFDYANFRAQLDDARQYFALNGYNNFIEALRRDQILAAVKQNDFILNPSIDTSPRIIASQQMSNGRYAWQVQFDMTLTYDAGQQQRTQQLTVTALVVRVRETKNPHGLGITQILAKQ